jgi:hypothetical protein
MIFNYYALQDKVFLTNLKGFSTVPALCCSRLAYSAVFGVRDAGNLTVPALASG